MRKLMKDPRFTIVTLYVLVAVSWILASDQVLVMLVGDDSARLAQLQTYKGTFYVLVTALLLFLLIGHYYQRDKTLIDTLKEQDERLHLAHAVAGIGVWEWDVASGRTTWSREVEALYGMPPGTFAGTQEAWMACIYPPDRALMQRAIDEWFQNPGHFSVEYRVQRGDGSVRWLLSYGNTTYDESGSPLRILGINMDVTERHEAQEHLHRAAIVYENSRDGIVVTDEKTRVLAVNRAFSEMTGYCETELTGQHIRKVRSDKHGRHFYRRMWASINASGGWSGELVNRHKDGPEYPVWLSISAVKDSNDNVVNYVGVYSDLSQLKKSEEELEYLASHDPLTDLPNRRLLDARLEHAIDQARRHNTGLAVLMLDIDRFKDINDSLGLEAGDTLLQETAKRVSDSIRGNDTVARLGGDELIVVLDEIKSPHQAADAAEKILEVIARPYEIEGQTLYLTASIGISLYPENGQSPEPLIRHADAAVYRAKEQGRNQTAFYSESLSLAAEERLALQNGLRQALQQGQLALHYQPQLCIESGAVVGVEALIRWHHPEKGMIPPDVFIPLAEQSGLIIDVGQWVLEEACRQMSTWRYSGIAIPQVSVNLSANQLVEEDLADVVVHLLNKYQLPAEVLELELTETAIMRDPFKAEQSLDAIAALGVVLAVDDFGTGYSSLAYLQRLKLHKLKIDRAFVRDLPHNQNSAAICRAVIAMAQSLNMITVAEGIEDEVQREFLHKERCEMGQGWLFAKAMPAAELESWLHERSG